MADQETRTETPKPDENWNAFASRMNALLADGWLCVTAFPATQRPPELDPLGFTYVFVRTPRGKLHIDVL